MSTTLKRHQLFIGGKWSDSSGGEDQEIINPATGKVIAHVPKGTAEDVDRAGEAATKSYDEVGFDTAPGEPSETRVNLAGRAPRPRAGAASPGAGEGGKSGGSRRQSRRRRGQQEGSNGLGAVGPRSWVPLGLRASQSRSVIRLAE